jgi:nitrate/nitrite-specific signal transduction histidine kinase
VHDDGGGVTTDVFEDGLREYLDLYVMRDRATRIDATLRMWSRAQRVTEVVLIVPERTAFRPATVESRKVAGSAARP